MKAGEDEPEQHSERDPEPRRAGADRAPRCNEGGREHDAFDADVEDAGAFRGGSADRRKPNRHAEPYSRGKDAGYKQRVHQASAFRIGIAQCSALTAKMTVASTIHTSGNGGSASSRCRAPAPAKKIPQQTGGERYRRTASRRAISATAMPANPSPSPILSSIR